MPLETIAGFGFLPLEFDRDARLVDRAHVDAVLDEVRGGVTDLLVLSHGWNNDMAQARSLYGQLLRSVAAHERGRLAGRRLAVVGVLWPSRKFADRDLIPGGAASLGGDFPLAALEEQVVLLRDVLGDAVTSQLLADAGKLDTTRAARTRFGEAVQRALQGLVDADDADGLPDAALTMPGEDLLTAIDAGDPGADLGAAGQGGVAVVGSGWTDATGPEGAAAGLGGLWRGVRSAASQLLNLTTYWAMKHRAGVIGEQGLHPVLQQVRETGAPALHLAGHSFGARLLTAAVAAGDASGPTVETLTLLQGAFSHHGFAVDFDDGRDGHFRRVLAQGRVAGPVLVTHTVNDLPNRWAYPAASRLARHTGAAVGNADSLYGAIGTNGARLTPEAVEGRLLPHTASYAFHAGALHNLEGSDFVSGHSAVAGPEVANALVDAIASRVRAPVTETFDPDVLTSSTIAVPLLQRLADAPASTRLPVTIDLHRDHAGGLGQARRAVTALLLGTDAATEGGGPDEPTGTASTGSGRRSPMPAASAEQSGDAPEPGDDASGDDPERVDPLVGWAGIVRADATAPADEQVIDVRKGELTPQYVHAWLLPAEIRALAELDGRSTRGRAVHRIWPDFEVDRLTTRSVRTVKADAARIAFSAAGDGVVWAVADTGIDGGHDHFALHRNLELSGPMAHQDFVDGEYDLELPRDPDGHGTHVAGIIAGERPITAVVDRGGGEPQDWSPARWVAWAERTSDGDVVHRRGRLQESISGVAPRTRLVSLRVLDRNGRGRVSNLLAAIGYVQQVNDHGRWLRIHGLNLSVGYGFDPEWFACGQSPLCVEVDRLVRSGVSVVVAAGNTGYLRRGGPESPDNAGLDLTINDPGNAELAITVGATHRDEPHVYGVSYFSSKGPTGDGRAKPDLVAPGEKILSCAAGRRSDEAAARADGGPVHYRAESGTSMAAPHVSGAIAAFLSIRPEFRGQPQRVKQLFLDGATDLGREHYFQGRGLVDLMRTIQSV